MAAISGSGVAHVAGASGGGAFLGARLALHSNLTVASDTTIVVPFDIVMFDTSGIASAGAHTMTVPAGLAGTWRFECQLLFDSNGSAGTDWATSILHATPSFKFGAQAKWNMPVNIGGLNPGVDPFSLLWDTGPVVAAVGDVIKTDFHELLGGVLGGANDALGTGAWCYLTAQFLGA